MKEVQPAMMYRDPADVSQCLLEGYYIIRGRTIVTALLWQHSYKLDIYLLYAKHYSSVDLINVPYLND